jgi:Family of unknown function (DUF6328)
MTDEDHKERVNRELIELLNELRVALPGVQVLFAFLLVLPFQQGFADISDTDRVAPSMYHRLNFRRQVKEQMLFDSNKLLVVGMVLVAVGVACSIFLVVDVVYGGSAAIVATAAAAVVYGLVWLALPLARRGEPEP